MTRQVFEGKIVASQDACDSALLVSLCEQTQLREDLREMPTQDARCAHTQGTTWCEKAPPVNVQCNLCNRRGRL